MNVFLSPQVDCTANSNTCSKYGVSGYPTLKIFRDGEESGPYDGPRTAGLWLCCDFVCYNCKNTTYIFLTCGHLCVLCLFLSLCLSADGIVSFLKKQAGPASVEVKADAELAKYIGDQDASVVGELLI